MSKEVTYIEPAGMNGRMLKALERLVSQSRHTVGTLHSLDPEGTETMLEDAGFDPEDDDWVNWTVDVNVETNPFGLTGAEHVYHFILTPPGKRGTRVSRIPEANLTMTEELKRIADALETLAARFAGRGDRTSSRKSRRGHGR